MIKELKAFLFRGNVLDLAVGMVIGAAFTAIVSSLVADIITPLIGLLFGTPDFSGIKLFDSLMIGNFINAVVSFLIVGTVLFFVVKAANMAMPKKKEEEPAPAGPSEVDLLQDILAELKNK
ncbi:large conductance mechanosensitive channel protein MscL [Aerococcaceae bacterium NML190938]|nr:large conductance mechanosensitive channel protein MscL [Aerococcaceae bacterium NML190938]